MKITKEVSARRVTRVCRFNHRNVTSTVPRRAPPLNWLRVKTKETRSTGGMFSERFRQLVTAALTERKVCVQQQ